ncbi:hypothetical protein Y695_01682 [Hydrogenophaga sp. T4]|nr:hypothetical protein Y695_01682 [Hydrogenophaga sp. T4]
MDFWHFPAIASAELLNKVGQEFRNVFQPLGQTGNVQRHAGKAVEQIEAELSQSDEVVHFPVGGGHQPEVDLAGAVLTQPLDCVVLEHPQQLHLDVCRNVADLVQEHGALVGEFEFPDTPLFVAARETAWRVAEQFRFQQARRQGGKVQRDHLLFPTGAQVMQGLRHQLFADTALAKDQHGNVEFGDDPDFLLQVEHRCAVPDEPAQ